MAACYTKAYVSTEVNTSDRVNLVISLYRAAIAAAERAMEAMETGRDSIRREQITKAADVLMTLCDSLDYSQPGSLAGNLFGLYSYCIEQLLEANRRNDLVPLQSVLSSLNILLESWLKASTSPEARAIREADAVALCGSQVLESVSQGRRETIAISA